MSAPYYLRPTSSLLLRDQVRADVAATLDGMASARRSQSLDAARRDYDEARAILGRTAEVLHELATELRREVGA